MSAALDALDAAAAAIRGLNFDRLDPAVRLRLLERMEASRRRQIAVSHDVIAGLAREDPAALGGPVHKVIADWLRISCAEASRRLHDATQLSPRLTLTGQELPPELPATAVAWSDGLLDGQHLRVIQAFVRDLPASTPVAKVETAERFLANEAAKVRPDQLQKLAHRYALSINPDGKFSDADRARQRGFTWCGQSPDGMSVGKLVASPELRANLDAWMSHFAAPGMCNPDDETPCVGGEPDDECARRDPRSHAQRQHDALNALVRGQLGDPKLGQHNGLPVAVIVATTLQELTSGTGRAVTGGGTLLPMRDVIRMGSHAYHYLVVFDEHFKPPTVSRPVAAHRLAGSARRPLRARPRLHASRLRRARLLVRGASPERMGGRRHDRCRQPHLRLRAAPQAGRKGLADKERCQRGHRVDTAAAVGPRGPHQRLSPPRARRRRPRRPLTSPT